MQPTEPNQDEPTKRHVDDLHRALRAKQGANLIGVGVSTFWRYHATDPSFPRGRRLSARCTVFPLAELLTWLDSKTTTEQT